MAEKKQQLAQFSRDAEIRAESFDADSNTVDIVWTTGASVRRFSWLDGEEYDEVLSLEAGSVRLERLNLGAPFLDTHCSWALDNVIGSVIPGSAKIESGRGTATIKLSKAAGVADTVQKIREGVIRNISVGYWVHKVVKTEADDASVARWDVVDWEPLEVSAVPIPADPGSQIRSEVAADGNTPATRSCTFLIRKPPASSAKRLATKEKRMATRTPGKRAAAKSAAAARAAELEKKKRLAAAKRDEDAKDEDEERDEDDEKSVKDKVDDIHDEVVDEAEDDDEERDADEDDEERDEDGENGKDDDEKRAAAKTARIAANEAVKAERRRISEITAIAARAGLPKTGQRHVDKGTSVKRFKEVVLERMLKDQDRDAPIRGLSADEDVVRARGVGRSGGSEARQIAEGAAHWRDVAKLSGKSGRTDTTIAAS